MADVFRPEYRELSAEEKDQINGIKEKALELYNLFTVPATQDPTKGRYIALAKTSLEESIMWATKALTS